MLSMTVFLKVRKDALTYQPKRLLSYCNPIFTRLANLQPLHSRVFSPLHTCLNCLKWLFPSFNWYASNVHWFQFYLSLNTLLLQRISDQRAHWQSMGIKQTAATSKENDKESSLIFHSHTSPTLNKSWLFEGIDKNQYFSPLFRSPEWRGENLFFPSSTQVSLHYLLVWKMYEMAHQPTNYIASWNVRCACYHPDEKRVRNLLFGRTSRRLFWRYFISFPHVSVTSNSFHSVFSKKNPMKAY